MQAELMQEKCHLHCASSQCRSSPCIYFGSPQTALLRCITAFSWPHTSHKVTHMGSAFPLQPGVNDVLEQQVPAGASWEQFIKFWGSLKQTGKQLHNANFEITFHSTSNFNLYLFTHPFLLLSLKKICEISVSSVLQATGHTNALISN